MIRGISLSLAVLSLLFPIGSSGQEQLQGPQPLFEPIKEKPLPAEVKAENLELKIEDGLVYLKAKEVDLKELLTRLGEQGGFETSINSSSVRISLSIKGLSVEDTIHRIMNLILERNYNIFYNEKGEIRRLEVFSTEQPPAKRPVIPAVRRSFFPSGQSPQMPPPPLLPQVEDESQQ